MAEICRETGVLPCDLASGGPAVCVRRGGKGEIPGVDALAGAIHGLPGGFVLSDVQSLPSAVGSPADGGGRAFGGGAVEAVVGDLQRGVRGRGGKGIGGCPDGDLHDGIRAG